MSTHMYDTHIGQFRVSTVALPDGYETAIFDDNGSEVVEHYRSELDARSGHTRWVANVSVGRSER